MTSGNFEQILDLQAEIQPFRIYTLELFGGELLEVDGPEVLSMIGGVAVFTGLGGAKMFLDHDCVAGIHNTTAARVVAMKAGRSDRS
jgi:hypothetical protein